MNVRLHPTIIWITARSLLGRRRVLLLIPMPLLLIGLALIGRASNADVSEWGQVVLVGLGINVVLPLTALIIGTSVLGSEIDDGTVVHILAKPLPRLEIVLSKLTVAAGTTFLVGAVPLSVAGMLVDSSRVGMGLLIGGAVGTLAYSAAFLALSLVTRRSVAFGLFYLLLWEALLGNFLRGTEVLSVQQYVLSLSDRVVASDLLESSVSAPVALVLGALVAAGGVALATDRLRSFSLTGDTD